jgi:hypothetical protein
MSVLSSCASKDPYADRFLGVIKVFKSMIEAQEPSNFGLQADLASGRTIPNAVEQFNSQSSLSSLADASVTPSNLYAVVWFTDVSYGKRHTRN